MIEFGSDFHYISGFQGTGNTLGDFYPHANSYADGRQALIHLYHSQGWQRLWVPEYFCYDVITTLKEAGLNLIFYQDYPTNQNDSGTLEDIQRHGSFREGDAVLRVNYFGMRPYRSSEKLTVPVVEDHTHDLIGHWATHSTADWCIASLRKTLPVPEGGMLWSPIRNQLPPGLPLSEENERIASIRWNAMRLKSGYLNDEDVEKAVFRKGYVDTEEYFDHAPVCALDEVSQKYLKTYDVRGWYNQKRDNWELLRDIRKEGVQVVSLDCMDCYPFSLVLLFDEPEERDRVRKALIEHQVYPAVLWNVPEEVHNEVRHFSQRMLSVHCDGRYNADDIRQMKDIIETIL